MHRTHKSPKYVINSPESIHFAHFAMIYPLKATFAETVARRPALVIIDEVIELFDISAK